MAFRASMQKLTDLARRRTGAVGIAGCRPGPRCKPWRITTVARRATGKRPAGEWQAVVTMLLSAMSGMLDSNDRNAARLKEIAGRVRIAAEVDEVHRIRLQLAECLAELHLNKSASKRARSPTPPPAAKDAVAGFRTARPQAEDALIHAWQTEPPSYVAVMALDRLQIFNMRFGHSVGDEVVRFYGGISPRTHPSRRPHFRWNDSGRWCYRFPARIASKSSAMRWRA